MNSDDRRQALENEFAYLKANVFSRWDKDCRWKVAFVSFLNGAPGNCNLEKSVVEIVDHFPEAERLPLLIHEIAHAITAGGHGAVWQQRMLKAADKIDALGRKDIADAVREDVRQVREYRLHPDRADCVYGDIADAFSSGQVPDFEQLMSWIGRSRGMSAEEVLKKYKRCRKVYDDSVKLRRSAQPKPRY